MKICCLVVAVAGLSIVTGCSNSAKSSPERSVPAQEPQVCNYLAFDVISSEPISSKADLECHERAANDSLRHASAVFSAVDARPIPIATDDGPFAGNLQPSAISFYNARNKRLSDADIERYIDPRITGDVRVQVHAILKAMPPAQRRNFASYEPGNVIWSNTWEDYLYLRSQIHPLHLGYAVADVGAEAHQN